MKIICDFDGTAAKNDVGNLLFRTFGDGRCYDIVNLWKEGKISSRECLILECQTVRVSKKQLEHFADNQQIDPHLKPLVEFCHQREIEITIVSDGLDFYIQKILKNHGLAGLVEVRANHLVFLDHDQIQPQFPYFEFGCGLCGNCKGFHVREAQKQGHRVIYIGDGLSDRCGAKEADIVFAKQQHDLLAFCQEQGIPYHEFMNLEDVLNQLKIIGH
jgi:2,3-diketo-5-methylthio-1-phosphopentane phosphatase